MCATIFWRTRGARKGKKIRIKGGAVILDAHRKEITRRGFIAKVGQGLVAANVAAALFKDAAAQQPQLIVPEPPGEKLGWAIVGLGNLAIHQILPAFAQCEKSKVVALVTGHPHKPNNLPPRYAINPN